MYTVISIFIHSTQAKFQMKQQQYLELLKKKMELVMNYKEQYM